MRSYELYYPVERDSNFSSETVSSIAYQPFRYSQLISKALL